MLSPQDAEEKRNKVLDEAVALREKSDESAIEMFKQIREWELAHGEDTADITGHLFTAYKILAQKSEDNRPEKEKWQKLALETAEEAVSLAKESGRTGAIAIALTHYSTAQMEAGDLEGALESINTALENFPGSEAHKAWGGNHKVQVLWRLGREEEAWDALTQCKIWLNRGYEDEMKDEHGERKLAVWWSGLVLTEAGMHLDSGAEFLGRLTAESILQQPDPEEYLVMRKSQTRDLLQKHNLS